eukprot:1852625-Lingulodinium_polyedra.AAC.1
MDRKDMRGLWYLAMNGGPGFQLPRREMPVVLFKNWATLRYQQQGMRLQSFDPKCDWVDWEYSVGVVAAVMPPPEAEQVVRTVRDRFSGARAPLPAAISVADLSDKYCFLDNWSLETAKLFNVETEGILPFKN